MAVIREFFSALVARETYDPRRNSYILFGLLWGLPIPILGILLELQVRASVGSECAVHHFPVTGWTGLHIVLGLHPLFFAVVFGALGTIRLRKTARIQDLLDRLADEVGQLAHANEELRELDRLKDEFLGNVTHELKTPLVTIRGYTEMLKTGRLGGLSDRQERSLSVVHRNTLRLQTQIHGLLACSRNRDALTRLQPRRITLAHLLREVHDRHAPGARDKGVTLEIQEAPGDLALWGDNARLREVLDNLLSNAVKFTDPGGRVALTLGEPDGERLPVTVEDTGRGISPDAQAFIFDRFRQADGSIRRQFGGTGIGLAIVRSNLEAHGCSIRVDSEPGKGARFSFQLPLAAPAAEEAGTE